MSKTKSTNSPKKDKRVYYFIDFLECLGFSKLELNYLADKKEKDFYMNLKGRSGCWDSFILKEWDLKEK